jgi:hypothetical protein
MVNQVGLVSCHNLRDQPLGFGELQILLSALDSTQVVVPGVLLDKEGVWSMGVVSNHWIGMINRCGQLLERSMGVVSNYWCYSFKLDPPLHVLSGDIIFSVAATG